MRRLLVCLGLAACSGDGASTASGTTEPDATTTGSAGSSSSAQTTSSGSDATTQGADDDSSTGEPAADYNAAGPYGVGVQSFPVAGRERELLTTIWYPSPEIGGSTPLAQLAIGENSATLARLFAAAPAQCVEPNTAATLDATPQDGSYPLVMFSHCLSCLGTSSSFVAERMASHGILVVGVTHTDDTLFDQLDGVVAPLSARWLATRSQDVSLVLDAILADGPVAGLVDVGRLGVFGHSYGAATAGKVLVDDDRFVAGVALAAPVESPLLPGVTTAAIDEPMLFVLAQEDNSILEIGNNILRNNAEAMPGGSWLVELADAGHWSVSNLCGVVQAFDPGCGEGTRQTNGEPFTYLDATTARQITASYVTAFFALHLLDDDDALARLNAAEPAEVVTVTRFR